METRRIGRRRRGGGGREEEDMEEKEKEEEEGRRRRREGGKEGCQAEGFYFMQKKCDDIEMRAPEHVGGCSRTFRRSPQLLILTFKPFNTRLLTAVHIFTDRQTDV